MQAHPELVSGEGRFDWLLHQIFGDNLVAKGGAEALQAIGFTAPARGIVVKVLDGGERALAPACLAVLAELGLLPEATHLPELVAAQLAQRAHPRLLNYKGLETGSVRVLGKLRAR
jgi:L-asparaginase II